MQNRFIVANWKMQLSCTQAIELCHKIATSTHFSHPYTNIIICPSFESLWPAQQALSGTGIALGAQSCSTHAKGSYTGQVAAQSLAELGCSYCIIGHSERRIFCKETDQDIALQLEQLLRASITPIICVGELKQQEINASLAELQTQLNPLFTVLNSVQTRAKEILIAYEPVWAIGTGNVPSTEHLTATYSWLHKYCSAYNFPTNFSLLYGGSVGENNITALLSIEHINGLLIGGASLDFQKFKNIVSLISD